MLNNEELAAVNGGDTNDNAVNVGMGAAGASLGALAGIALAGVAAPAVVVVGLGALGLAGAFYIGTGMMQWW